MLNISGKCRICAPSNGIFSVAWSESGLNCKDLAPQIGTTGTPVYDPRVGTPRQQ